MENEQKRQLENGILEKDTSPLQVDDKVEEKDAPKDTRSPLKRFRSFPKRPLTVTDLTSGAWCELQYWYTLTRLPGGRRTRTPAMKQGSHLHQKLEEEVHRAVKIDIETKEDAFGLRLWNLVQGLRTLRDTGITRELEVWGMVDGNLVNGVIDSVSYQNPNPEFEETLSSQGSEPQRQAGITEYFPQRGKDKSKKTRQVFLTDVKTRRSKKPVSEIAIRPAKIQLLLYHSFLSDMAAGKLDYLKVFRRYGLDPDDPFTDTFMAEIGSLHDDIFTDTPSGTQNSNWTSVSQSQESEGSGRPTPISSGAEQQRSSAPDLLKYNTLRELISLVQDEIKLTFPNGEESIGQMLRVEYIYQQTGEHLDDQDFPVSRPALEKYLSDYMRWWRGEREANGVQIEDAWKCNTCEFGEDCSWREEMSNKVKKAAFERQEARRAKARYDGRPM